MTVGRPPIYFINLDARPDRRAFMERQFAELGLEAKRVSASTADEISETHLTQYCDPGALHYHSPSEMACWYSHVQCWRSILDTGARWGLVFEDDAVLSPRLPAFLDAFFATGLDGRCDIVQLETIARRTRVLPAIAHTEAGIALRPFRSTVYGTAAYLIRATMLPSLLSDPHLFDRPVDHRLFCPFLPAVPGWRLLLTDPGLCIQVHRWEQGELAQSDIVRDDWPATKPSIIRERQRLIRRAAFANFVDHLRHIPRGIRSRLIPFDAGDNQWRRPDRPMPES